MALEHEGDIEAAIPQADSRAKPGNERAIVARLFDDTRKRLVETGTRNRLIHVNRANTRGNVINVVNERSDELHAILSAGKAMRFLALGVDQEDDADTLRLVDSAETEIASDRYTDKQLETRLGPDALQKKLLKIAREAQTAEEESGVNILYLALGFLTWFEDKSTKVAREAPLVLLPVELVRNARSSTFDLKLRDDEVPTNLPLQQRLKEDFGIALPDLEIGEDWTPSRYFAAVREVTAQKEGWRVDADAIQLGFFSFSKLLMYRDLAVEAWPDGALAEHPLTRGLLYEGFERQPPLFTEEDRLDDVLPPAKQFHVVDADASQAKVIEEVRSGRNLVVQGPPGTGKSQTITNIIAAAAREGKRVLFVAEKMAALSVVHDRLVKVGLEDLCLELHSRGANKKAVLTELARTLSRAQAVPAQPGARTALQEARDKLNDLAQVLHEPLGDTGETPFTLLGLQARFIGRQTAPPSLAAACLSAMTRVQEKEVLELLLTYGELLHSDGDAVDQPYAGTRALGLQPVDLSRLVQNLHSARERLELLLAALRTPSQELDCPAPLSFNTAAQLEALLGRLEGLPPGMKDLAALMLEASDLPRLQEALAAGRAWRDAVDRDGAKFVEAAFTAPVAHLRAPLIAGLQSFLTRWFGAYRAASRELGGLLRAPLPRKAAERVALVDALCDIQTKRKAWEDDKDFCARTLGDAWRGEKTDFMRLDGLAAWCADVRSTALICPGEPLLRLAETPERCAQLREALRQSAAAARAAVKGIFGTLDLDVAAFAAKDFEQIDLERLSARFDRMAQESERYTSWAQRARFDQKLVEAGLGELAEKLREGRMDGPAAAAELRFARAERLWRLALESNERLKSLAALNRHELVALFKKLDRQNLQDNVREILAGHLQQLPQGALGEMKVLRGEIGKKRGHMALRRLFERAGNAIQRTKPVLLMSPISIAQFLPPGTLSFDLLVIDEASQVRPEDALGAIARASQIVVVGDNKQLPPSSFFDRLLGDDAEADDEDGEGEDPLGGAARVADLESILRLCEARGLNSRMLSWHYRSRDPSLMRVSNKEFYKDGLILPPSPLQEDPAYGLCLTRVDGVYDRGGKRDNRIEGEALVTRVAEHARRDPTLSLGVVTFSSAQRNLITELLELRRRQDPVLDDFLREGQSEDLFVKNIENVQGDERDVILVSVGYGPSTPGGRLGSMSFGPVNAEGGERRLNVLFTRARIRCEIFCSFDPGDMDLNRTSREGPRVLKRFLDYAAHGQLEDREVSGLRADSLFEEDVAEVIRGFGFLADPQVGSAGFRIDLGVRHPDKPGTYLLAVECDGATYHSALWARERDRLRQDVLEHLGWRFHRIWSTDWFYRRHAETERLHAALLEAREQAARGVKVDGANKRRPQTQAREERGPELIDLATAPLRQMPPYRRVDFKVNSGLEPHEAPAAVLRDLARRVVVAEGPIHLEEASRRIASAFGKDRTGRRILAATEEALRQAQSRDAELLSDGEFWFTKAQSENPPVRDRSAEEGATVKAGNISMLEIAEALRIARDDNAGGQDADLVRSAARLLGFSRVGAELHARITSAL